MPRRQETASPETLKIKYRPPKTLRKFMRSNARVRAIVGPIGSGKSSVCVMEILRRAIGQRQGPDGVRRTRFAVIRNTRPQLQDTTRKTFAYWAEEWMPVGLGDWSESDFTFHIYLELEPGDVVDCEVLFRALDKPRDVRKVLSLELTGAYINEAREVAKEVFDGLQGRVGRYPSVAQGGCTWRGVWCDTNPWHVGHWGYQLFTLDRPSGFELFEQPDALGSRAENTENLIEGYYRDLQAGKDQEWIDEYLRAQYPNADRGSVFGEWLARLEQRGGVLQFESPADGIYASFDLGISDSTAIWFWRFNADRSVDVVDHYETHGQGAAHYFDVLKAKGYRYERIFLPHDARARTFQTGVSTLDLFLKEYPALVAITPELSVADGIGAARWLLEQPIRFHARCAEGLKRLRAYRYEWDEDKKVYSKKPMHDWASHTADAFRYLACAVQGSELLTRPKLPAPPFQVVVRPPTFNGALRQGPVARRIKIG